jgi:superfamily II DNA/RNA helicase
LEEVRKPNRPRALVLVPTRELAAQVQAVAKELSHHAKLSVRGAFGGSDGVGKQRNTLRKGGAYDLLIATPGRFEKLWDLGDVRLSRTSVVVVDEVDTMLSQGFGAELEKVLRATTDRDRGAPATLVTTTATLTPAVRRAFGDKSTRDARWQFLPQLRMVETQGLHKSTERCRLELIDVVGKDKLAELAVVLKRRRQKCLVFCNTVSSCRAAEHFLAESDLGKTFSYHGELNSREREASLKAFREDSSDGALVCTDLAARGLDIPDVDHVIMFDFPRNPIDYLHRAGRTARAGKSGRVSALVAKGDRVLAAAVQKAILNGESLDALSADKRAYLPGGNLHVKAKRSNLPGRRAAARRDLAPAARKPSKPRTRRSR